MPPQNPLQPAVPSQDNSSEKSSGSLPPVGQTFPQNSPAPAPVIPPPVKPAPAPAPAPSAPAVPPPSTPSTLPSSKSSMPTALALLVVLCLAGLIAFAVWYKWNTFVPAAPQTQGTATTTQPAPTIVPLALTNADTYSIANGTGKPAVVTLKKGDVATEPKEGGFTVGINTIAPVGAVILVGGPDRGNKASFEGHLVAQGQKGAFLNFYPIGLQITVIKIEGDSVTLSIATQSTD